MWSRVLQSRLICNSIHNPQLSFQRRVITQRTVTDLCNNHNLQLSFRRGQRTIMDLHNKNFILRNPSSQQRSITKRTVTDLCNNHNLQLSFRRGQRTIMDLRKNFILHNPSFQQRGITQRTVTDLRNNHNLQLSFQRGISTQRTFMDLRNINFIPRNPQLSFQRSVSNGNGNRQRIVWDLDANGYLVRNLKAIIMAIVILKLCLIIPILCFVAYDYVYAKVFYYDGYYYKITKILNEKFNIFQNKPKKNDDMKLFTYQQDQKFVNNLIITNHKESTDSNYLLIGPKGVGKTTLAILSANSAEKGVIYIEATSELSEFINNLSRVVNFVNFKWINWIKNIKIIKNLTNGINEVYEWDKRFHKFEKFAEKIKRKENYTTLLIIDNAELLMDSDEGKEVLQNIKISATSATEHGNYHVMFIVNNQKTLDFLLENTSESNKSHMETIYLRDLEKEAVSSHLSKHGVYDKDIADKVYEVFGGRLFDLSHVIKHIKVHNGDKEALNDYFNRQFGIIVDKWNKCVYTTDRSKVLEFLYNHLDQSFNRSDFIKTFNEQLYKDLVQKDILTMAKHLEVTFGSPAVKYVFKNLLFKDIKKNSKI